MKSKIEIISFLYLTDEEYFKIIEYRNQKFVRNVSCNTEKISYEQHLNYRELLKKKDNYFSFLIKKDGQDYAVISFKKCKNGNFTAGDYLIDEEFQFEGGGIIILVCEIYLCNYLKIEQLEYEVKLNNKRGLRNSKIFGIKQKREVKDGFVYEIVKILPLDSLEIQNSRFKKLFDKLYEIEVVQI